MFCVDGRARNCASFFLDAGRQQGGFVREYFFAMRYALLMVHVSDFDQSLPASLLCCETSRGNIFGALFYTNGFIYYGMSVTLALQTGRLRLGEEKDPLRHLGSTPLGWTFSLRSIYSFFLCFLEWQVFYQIQWISSD